MTKEGGPYKAELNHYGKIHFSMNISPDLHNRMLVKMKETELTRTEWIRLAIQEKVERD